MTRLSTSLQILRRLNLARARHDRADAALLTELLDEHDAAAGWMRSIKPVSDALQPGQRWQGRRHA